jgi:hypothetical protein
MLNGCNDAHLETAMPFEELIAHGQACAQIWEQILYSSGRVLELKKCFWYMVYWQWVNGHPQMAPTISCPGIIALTSGKVPNYTVIPRLEVWEARKMLDVRPAPDGNYWNWEARKMLDVRPAPDGNYWKEGDFLLNKVNKYATRLATSRLSKLDTFIFHRSTYIPSMTYSLSAMTFDTKTLNKIQHKAVQAILNKIGVSKSFP